MRTAFLPLLALLAPSACHSHEVLVQIPPPAWMDGKIDEQARVADPKGVRAGEILHGTASARTSATWVVPLDSAHCYWLSGLGGDGVARIAIYVTSPSGKRGLTLHSPTASVLTQYCPAEDGAFTVEAKTGGAAGVVGAGVYAVARAASAPPPAK